MHIQIEFPLTRTTDPSTSAEAAAAVAPGEGVLALAICATLRTSSLSAFEIADVVEEWFPGRWDAGTIRSKVSRMHKAGDLEVSEESTLSPRGQRCALYWRSTHETPAL